jgi:hypothetical protein
MKPLSSVKFPHSVQLFKFCQKVLSERKNKKIHDQEVGEILDFNPSDCSHWKRGEKNVKSVFSLSKLSEVLDVDTALLHDLASGILTLDEAYYEYSEARDIKNCLLESKSHRANREYHERIERVRLFIQKLHEKAEYKTPPLYLPEVFRFFPYIRMQPVEMIEKLSRVLRTKPGQYTIQFKKTELKPQTRMSIVQNFAKILLEGERHKFPELSSYSSEFMKYEELAFVAEILIPKELLQNELKKLDVRRNLILELSSIFWAPKLLVAYQLQNILDARPIQNLDENEPSYKTNRTANLEAH